jgi:F-type H+-transporting ATPase subunit a
MPQLVPFYFINQVVYTFILLVIMIYQFCYFFKNFINMLKNLMYKYTYISSPLNQFEIRNLLSLDAPILGDLQISLTNIGLYLTIGAFAVLTLNVLSTNYNKVISNS